MGPSGRLTTERFRRQSGCEQWVGSQATTHRAQILPVRGERGVCVSKRGGGEAQSTWSWPFPKPSRLSSSVQMEAHGGLSELLLDASLECLILMKKSFICRPVSRRQVWKEFSQVTEALGRVFAGGKCKAVRLAQGWSCWGGSREGRGGNRMLRKKCSKSQEEEEGRGATKRPKCWTGDV